MVFYRKKNKLNPTGRNPKFKIRKTSKIRPKFIESEPWIHNHQKKIAFFAYEISFGGCFSSFHYEWLVSHLSECWDGLEYRLVCMG